MKRPALLLGVAPLVWASALAAQTVAPLGGGPAVIEVSGTAIVTVAPELATVPVTVQNAAETSISATLRTEQDVARLIAFAKASGAGDADIKVEPVRMLPRTRAAMPAPGATGTNATAGAAPAREPDGFEATSTIRVQFRDLEKASRFSRDARDNGATRVSPTTYSVLDHTAGADKAREAAFQAARRKAEKLAAIAGLKLGRVVRITSPARDFFSLAALSRSADAISTDDIVRVTSDLPRDAKTTEVRANLDVAWAAE